LYQQGQITSVNSSPKFYLSDVATFEIPFNFQLADCYSTVLDEQQELLFTGINQNDNFSGGEYKLCGEYGHNDLFFVRARYQLSPDQEDYLYGFTAGIGINYQVEEFGVKIDYAFRDFQFFDVNHVIALTLGF
jgi:hypothetical protein